MLYERLARGERISNLKDNDNDLGFGLSRGKSMICLLIIKLYGLFPFVEVCGMSVV